MKNILVRLKELFPVTTHQRVFLVGGAVRDYLQGEVITDIDLAAALTPQEFAELGFQPVEGKSTAAIWHRHIKGFGTIEVTPLPDEAHLGDDLYRRDFTINAMAITLMGEIIDPLDGRSGLNHKRLFPCSRHSFIDDPLRIFRAFRFVAAGWQMTAECEELLREHDWSQLLTSVPIERFSREMIKALATDKPERFFQLMLEYGIGHEFLPEIFRMPHIPAGPLIHHPEGDLFTHSLDVLQRVAAVSSDPPTRFCALFHDIGKLATFPALHPRHHGHEQAGFKLSGEFSRRLRLPAHYGKLLSWISRLHGKFHKWDELRDSTKLKTSGEAIKAGIADILPLVSAADKIGESEPAEWREALRIAGMSSTELGIDEQSLNHVQPSKRTVHILQKRVELFRAIRRVSS